MKTSKHERVVLGLLVDALEGTYQSTVLAGAAAAAEEVGASLLCVAGGALSLQNPSARNTIYDLVGRHNLDGLLVMSGAMANVVGYHGIDAFIERYRPIPICSIAVEIDGAVNVLVDNERGIRDAIAHLVHESNRSKIAFVRGPSTNAEAEERFSVYRRELARHGLAYQPKLVAEGDFSRASGAAAVRELFDERGETPDAIIAADDVMALGVLDAFALRGIGVPGDVAVMGFNDIEEARFATVPLTTVRQPLYEQGRQAVFAMMRLLEGEAPSQPVVLTTELIRRRSSDHLDPSETSRMRRLEEGAATTFADAFARRREEAIAEMEHAVLTATQGDARAWAAKLVDAFTRELADEAVSGLFVGAVRDVVQSSLRGSAVGSSWQEVISILRREAIPCLGKDAEGRLRAENLWQVARVAIAELVERAQVHQRLQAEGWARSLGQTTAALISSFDVVSLVHAISDEFPRLSISSCYLSLFVDDDPGAAELLLAYDSRHRQPPLEHRVRFAARDLAPAGSLPTERRAFVLEPLFFEDARLGFALFEYGPREGIIYEALRDQISASLKGALLVRQVIEKDRERELLMQHLERRAVQLERAYKALQEGQRRLLVSETMASIGQMTARVRPLAELFADILVQLTGLLGGEDAFVAVAVSSGGPSDDVEAMIVGSDGSAELRLEAGVGRFEGVRRAEALLEGQRHLVSQAYASGQALVGPTGVAIPLQVGGQVLGMMYLERAETTEHELELLATFSTQATVAIQNAQLYQMAALDPLTGVHARRFFDQWLPREVQGAYSGRRPLSVLMVDMDQMKRINDTGGHLAGDQALVTVGKVLREATRDHDVITRYGGDEFALILPNTDRLGAEVVGLRILDLASEKVLPGLDEPLRCSIGSSTLTVTRTDLGTTTPLPSRQLEHMAHELVGRADTALYQAKNRGGACLAQSSEIPWPAEGPWPDRSPRR